MCCLKLYRSHLKISATTADLPKLRETNFDAFLIPRPVVCTVRYTVAGKAIGFALEQPLHVVTLTCSVS
ncbi:MAG: hypothetical protein LBK06_01040 [Planctomycetaceae bacterium]|nr:hypothetical protein [Planctomycetaceae bacterium]